MRPVRIQLQRTSGRRLSPNTVSVAWMKGIWNPATCEHLPQAWSGFDEHHEWLRHLGAQLLDLVRGFAGRNLPCWCAVGQPCHGDVLLRLANARA